MWPPESRKDWTRKAIFSVVSVAAAPGPAGSGGPANYSSAALDDLPTPPAAPVAGELPVPPPPVDAEGWWSAVDRVAARLGLEAGPERRVRVAFVGQRTYFEVCSQVTPSAVIEPGFVEFRAGADGAELVGRLRAHDPDVVVVFRPEILPPALLRPLRATVIGFVTEPLPRDAGASHPDLERRLGEFAYLDPGQFDRIVTFDSSIAATVERYAPVWRSLPLPVDDRLHAPAPLDREVSTQPLFVGRSTPHRESFLLGAKHALDLLHVDHGVHGLALAELAARHLVAVNLHNEPYPSFENRVPLHLAMGNLVVSEPLSPTFGLEPGLDHLEVTTPDELVDLLGLIQSDPDMFHPIRVRGHQKAEGFRASRVYADLILDLFVDVAAFGGRDR